MRHTIKQLREENLMDLFIINLPSSTDRRQFMVQQLTEKNITNYRFFEAANGKKLPQELEEQIDDQHRIIFRSRPLEAGERGIYASNYLLWKQCVEQNKPIVIIEDDVILHENFVALCEKAEQLHKQGYEYFRLGTPDTDQTPKTIDKINGIVHWNDNQSGSTRCYSISPNGAKKLLRASQKWICSVDNFVGEAFRTQLPCLGLIPHASSVAELETTIQSKNQRKAIAIFKVTREIYRFYRFIRLKIWNHISMKKHLPNI